MDSAPTLDKLMTLPEAVAGELPDPRERFVGCRFASRCPNVKDQCSQVDPLATVENDRRFYCHFPVR